MLVAAAVTFALRDYTDTGVILAVLLINALIGYLQESRAQREMAALADLAAPRAEELRDGAPRSVASRELVPGDVVLLASGARVPADLRLLAATGLEIDESALTGKSLPARKSTAPLADEGLVAGDQTNLAFAGTVVTRGRGRGLVVRTGRATEIGRITAAVRAQAEKVPPDSQTIEGVWTCQVAGAFRRSSATKWWTSRARSCCSAGPMREPLASADTVAPTTTSLPASAGS